MNMNIKLAVAGALALVAGNAMAITPAAIAAANTAGTLKTLYVSGATSSDGSFENLAKLNTGGYCQPGTLDIYYYKNASGSIQERAMACTSNSLTASGYTGTIAAGTPIVVFKESRGGSSNGIVNVATGAGLAFMDLFSGTNNFAASCTTVTTAPAATTDYATYNTHDCGATSTTASTVNTIALGPNAGVSDVDPLTFVGVGPVTAANAGAITNARRTIAVTFNPAVSVPLYLALQKAEGLVASSATVPDDSSVDKMPSIPATVARAIFNGNLFDASSVYITPDNASALPAVQLSTVLTAAGAFTTPNTNIFVCRRGDTSGSQLSIQVMFLNQGCGKNASSIQAFAKPDTLSCQASGCSWSNTTYGTANVFAGSGSGDVRSCMSYHSTQDELAVGVVSTEALPGAATSVLSSTFRYVKVDGQAPTLKSVMEGNYSYYSENSFNDTGLATAGTPTAVIWNFIYTNIGNSTAISKINESWRNGAAVGYAANDGAADVGILDLPIGTTHLPTLPVTAASVRTNPVNGTTKLKPSSTSANNCNLATQEF
jgi:hypothetical protein